MFLFLVIVVTCPLPTIHLYATPNISVIATEWIYSDALYYRCNDGHSYDGQPGFSTTCNASGSWTDVEQECTCKYQQLLY